MIEKPGRDATHFERLFPNRSRAYSRDFHRTRGADMWLALQGLRAPAHSDREGGHARHLHRISQPRRHLRVFRQQGQRGVQGRPAIRRPAAGGEHAASYLSVRPRLSVLPLLSDLPPLCVCPSATVCLSARYCVSVCPLLSVRLLVPVCRSVSQSVKHWIVS